MTTNYHDAFTNEALTAIEVNERLGDLDAAIDTASASASSLKFARVYDSKATTTDGGASSAATWNIRNLNAETDPDSIVAIASNRFTPIAGTYLIMATAPCFKGNEHRLKLYNHTGTADVLFGNSGDADNTNNVQSNAYLQGVFTANGTDAYELRHYITTAQTGDGLGQAVGDGAVEIYADITLIKLVTA